MPRVIVHLDMDAFFAAIEERDRPEIAGRPIVVGADPKGGYGRGVVSTCNYEARKFGVRSAMPISRAYELCPHAVFLPADGEKYAEVSSRIMGLIRPYGRLFEQVSIDEAYLNLVYNSPHPPLTLRGGVDGPPLRIRGARGVIDEWQNAEIVAREIKQKIYDAEQLTCSVGIGPNKLIAKMASEEKKPDGLTVVKPEAVQAFLDPKSVRALHGVGPKNEAHLQGLKVKTVAELRQWSREALVREFGKFGEDLYEMARGIDERPVVEAHEIKSIGRQTTFEEDTRDQGLILKTLVDLARQVHAELVAGHFLFKTVTVTIRYRGFDTHTHAHTFKAPTDSFGKLKAHALKLAMANLGGRPVRLIGVRVSHLQSS